jgi:general L-amino acid transport system permease protein
MTTMSQPQRQPGSPPEIRPPASEVGAVGWLRHNLFNSKPSGLITIVLSVILVLAAWATLQWAIGARWSVVTENMRLFLVGQYPPDQIWRVWLVMVVLSATTGLWAGSSRSPSIRMLAMMLMAGQLLLAVLVLISGAGLLPPLALLLGADIVWVAMYAARRRPIKRTWISIGWLVTGIAVIVLLAGLGDATPLPSVSSNIWGGLLLTMMLSVVGILLSFPLGVALAVGRRSRLPVVRIVSTTYIEVVRAVPLITVLFMAQFLFPLILPEGLRIENVIRAMGGITIFSAAYVAENVRGGLQAIPRGQHEAAFAIGLRTWQTTVFIVLPQALRITIPANVGLFISLLKDTTLVYIIGLLEILGIGRAVLAIPEYLGAQFEVYFFISVVFFVLSYTLSQASYRLEKELGIGER